MIEPDGDKVIDRDNEATLFKQLLERGGKRRLFLISDEAHRGKSTLLRKLRYYCDWELKPRTPTALVRLNDLLDPNPYCLIEALYKELVAAGVSFERFTPMHRAIQSRDTSLFRAQGAADFRGAQITGGQSAGTIHNLTVEAGGIVQVAGDAGGWDAAIESQARDRAVDVFFEELKAVCANRTTVLFLDSVDDQANAQLLSWVLDVFVRKFLDWKADEACLLLVLAGRSSRAPFDRFKKHYATVVESIETLGPWSSEHVRAFLELNQPSDRASWPLTDQDIEFLRDKINHGLTLGNALQMAALLNDRQDR